MSYVAVYPIDHPDTPNKVLTHLDDIQSTLAEHGVRFERWQPSPIERGASEAELIDAYQAQIDALGYGGVEVFNVTGDQPQKAELRARLDEVRRWADAVPVEYAPRSEPRLRAETLEVRVDEIAPTVEQRLTFEIVAEMIADPTDIPLQFYAEVDPAAGKIAMKRMQGEA